jgi:hypothetical protein
MRGAGYHYLTLYLVSLKVDTNANTCDTVEAKEVILDLLKRHSHGTIPFNPSTCIAEREWRHTEYKFTIFVESALPVVTWDGR